MNDINRYIRDKVMNLPYLNDSICYNTFGKMDKILERMYNIVSKHSDILTNIHLSLIIKVSTLSKNSPLFHYFDAQNNNSILRASDLVFLTEGFNYVRSILNGEFYDIKKMKINRGIIKEVFDEVYKLSKIFVGASNSYSIVNQNLSRENAYLLALYQKKIDDMVEDLGIDESIIAGINYQLDYYLKLYDKSFKRIYNAYLRVVYKEAKKIVKTKIDALPDAFQNGTNGLIKAINNFDTSMGFSFQTYASPWIRKIILEHSESEASFLPISNSVWRKYNKFQKLRNKNHDLNISDISYIAKHSNKDEKEVEKVLKTVENRKVLMLDAPIVNEEGGTKTLLDTISQNTFKVEEEGDSLPKEYIDNEKFMHLLFGIEVSSESKINRSTVRDEKVRQLLHLKEVSDGKKA